MTSLLGMFDSTTAQVILAIGLLIFLTQLGSNYAMRGYAAILKAKTPPPALPPPKPPPKELKSKKKDD